MPHHHNNPLWTANRAFVMFEALDLAAKAGRGETAWSRRSPEEPICAESEQPGERGHALRRAAAVIAAFAVIGGLAAHWMA